MSNVVRLCPYSHIQMSTTYQKPNNTCLICSLQLSVVAPSGGPGFFQHNDYFYLYLFHVVDWKASELSEAMSRFEILSKISRLCGGWACSSFLMRLHNVAERAASTAQHKTLMKKSLAFVLYEEIDYAGCCAMIQWSWGFSIIFAELFWDKYVQLATSNNQLLTIESYI